MSQLRITEIFYSLQGEADSIGWPTVFVRLTGCPLRCVYCDTVYAFHGGELLALDRVIDRVSAFNAGYVCVTGGEPLAQPACTELLQRLCDTFADSEERTGTGRVSIETSGALSIAEVDPRVTIVMDIKTPASGEADRNRLENLELIKASDTVKFVLADRQDYDWACEFVVQHRLSERTGVLFSPVYTRLPPQQLADWILEDRLPVRFQLQLHKVLWGEQPGR